MPSARCCVSWTTRLHATRRSSLPSRQPAYLALWATAFEDAAGAIDRAASLLSSPDPERRLVATHLLGQLALGQTCEALLPLLDDPDLRVALRAFTGLIGVRGEVAGPADMFERLERLLVRLDGRKTSRDDAAWPWQACHANAETVAHALIASLDTRSPKRLIAYMDRMQDYDRGQVAEALAALPTWDAEVHDTIFGLARDRSSWVRGRVLELLAKRPLAVGDAPALEALLTRKSGDVRRSILSLLLNQADDAALSSAERLLAARHPLQRLAGLDLLSELSGSGRRAARCHARAAWYRTERTAAQALTPEETVRLDALLSSDEEMGAAPTIENVLGLIAPEDLTPPVPPRRLRLTMDTPAARACLASLDALVEAHRTTPVTTRTWRGSDEMLLGNLAWHFPYPQANVPAEDDARDNLPLAEIWRGWEAQRAPEEHDPDGLELVRAIILVLGTRSAGDPNAGPGSGDATDTYGQLPFLLQVDAADGDDGAASAAGTGPNGDTAATVGAFLPGLLDLIATAGDAARVRPQRLRLRHPQLVLPVLRWLVYLQEPAPARMLDFLLDGVEAALASVPRQLLEQEREAVTAGTRDRQLGQWRHSIGRDGALTLVEHLLAWRPDLWTDAHHARYWALLHWLDRPLPGLPRQLPALPRVLAAHRAGGASEADVLEHLAASARNRGYYWAGHDGGLAALSGRASHPLMESYPVLKRLISALRERTLRVELARGEMPTAATPLALALRYTGGAGVFVRLVAALAPTDLARGYGYDNESRATVFSHLLRATFPVPDDTVAEFSRLAGAAGIETTRLVAAAVYAPQWARHVEQHLGWPHFEDAVWWTHAHTKDMNWSVDAGLKEVWQAQISERTPLTGQDLIDGAVDVDWFGRSYEGLGPGRWEQVYAAAKYASGGTGHARARLFADAMTGKLTAAELGRRITAKRAQDAVRALGLLPLPAADSRAEEVAARYHAIQEFVRGGKKFGAQRRASEGATARTGLENLARTAGFPDPMRLQWAMEAHLAADLRDGARAVTDGDIGVTLALDPLTSEPHVTVARADGRILKALPARLKKNLEIAALLERKREIERQVARMRVSLEAAMCRGDRFEAAELIRLLDHPVLARLLRNLVFVRDHDGGAYATVLGYPALVTRAGTGERRLGFSACDGRVATVDACARDLRLAHPSDLFASGAWHDWQHDCFASERIQPFKQVFRELYVLTANERRNGDDTLSGRYAGQQVQPRQALALLGTRGWIAHPNEGVRRAFHAEGLSAAVTVDDGFLTPAEVEGLTLGEVRFTRCGDWEPIPLVEVPARVFSEVMRDLDLVVSVAHRGGVDPEATASTVEMRAALVRETCGLLGLGNVDLRSAHALVKGGLGDYSIHLGSAVVHRQPGGALCIVPVHGQHRGRLFLPFSDDDPRTAEVVSKVVLLARDKEIKDPGILEQLL